MSTRQRRLRRLLVAVAGVCLLPSAADAATHSGSVQMSGTTQGLRVKMSGTLRIKTNPPAPWAAPRPSAAVSRTRV